MATILFVLVGIALPPSASAFWSVSTTVPSSGAARAAVVNQLGTPVATVATGNDITVDWPDGTLSNGIPVTGYTVTRYSSTDVLTAATGGCAGIVTASVCTENDVPDGLWSYGITPRFAANWIGPVSIRSTAVRSDITAPVNNLSRTNATSGSFLTGSTVFYRGLAAGSFTLTNALADSGSGPASSSTGTLTGSTTGWSHSPSAVSSPAGGPFVSNPFSWIAGTTSQPTIGISGADVAGNTVGTTASFILDNTAPVGGSISYASGTRRDTLIPVTMAEFTDAGAGMDAGPRQLLGERATLTGDSCGSFALFVIAQVTPPLTGAVATSPGFCYRFLLAGSDRVGNETVRSSTSIVKVKEAYASLITATAGLEDYFRLGDTGTVITDTQGGNNNGALMNTPMLGQPGAIAGDTDTAVGFTTGPDYGRATRTIGNDFSMEFWFKSGQGLSTSANWYDGAGLIDGEVNGASNDFGVSLSADGRVMAGVGNPDVTISSQTGLNNNAWHHVVMTRAQATGAIALYIDGVQVRTATGGTQLLNGPTDLNFGRIATGVNQYAGSLDEIALYSSVLTPAQVQSHYLNGL